MSGTPIRTRFAPSPTGYLHVGGARTALYNWLFARKHGGQFVLRVEDTDEARNTAEAQDAIYDGLSWLGLDWDEGPDVGGDHGPYRQSERREIYDRYLEKLRAADLVYEDEGAIRFRVPDQPIVVRDIVCGEQSINLRDQGSRRWDPELKQEVEANPDLVIRRPDGSYIFHFVNVVDDLEMGMTHVIRGEDHLSNTPKHVALFQALGAEPPAFAHIPLTLNPTDGTKMSKRDKGASVSEYVEGGFLPEAVLNYIALLGWSPKDDREIFTLEELCTAFELEGINQANSRFDYEKCVWVNGEHLKALTPEAFAEAARPFASRAGVPVDDPRYPQAAALFQERVQRLDAVPPALAVVFGEVETDPSAKEKTASREGVDGLLEGLSVAFSEAEAWTPEAIGDAIAAAAEQRGVKKGALMFPCRVATTGQASGADLLPLLSLIGRDTVLQRIARFRESL